MGWQDRQYNQSGGGFGERLSSASVVTWLLGINGVVFLLDSMLGGSTRGSALAPSGWGHFSVDKAITGLQIWRGVTYQFLHANFFHLFFNMLALYYFGPLMERWWGSRRFLAFYLLCGLGAAALFTLMVFTGVLDVASWRPLVGASGCIFGILVGCAMLYPDQRVMLLFPPIPMTLRTLALVFLGLAVLSIVFGSQNAGGEAAHLGGAALGWLLIKNPRWLDFADRVSVSKFRQQIKQAQRQSAVKEDAQVDKILDKVREHGLASLTDREKKILQRATDRQKDAG